MSERPRILFVDDESHVLEGLKRNLRSLRDEWEMEFFDAAPDALSQVERAGACVVVTDWMMPGMDGVSLIERLVEYRRESNESCYVILLTGRSDTSSVVEALEIGADDYIAKPFELREVIARIRVGLRVVQLERALREKNDQLRHLSLVDPLTALFNRRRADEVLAAEYERMQRGISHFGIVLFDLDHFKSINDRFGHETGDLVLKQVADCLKADVRPYDSVVRWGGEEILIICPELMGERLLHVADRHRLAIENLSIATAPSSQHPSSPVPVTVSGGFADTRFSGANSVEELVALADAALYRAKDSGRNRVLAAQLAEARR
ncbi:MAG: diguanylate cyclase [bacterium]|nr:diguanylate cyclase [bacterium]